jgi:hypothetical protein
MVIWEEASDPREAALYQQFQLWKIEQTFGVFMGRLVIHCIRTIRTIRSAGVILLGLGMTGA